MTTLPALPLPEFLRRLRAACPDLPDGLAERLHRYYEELGRWASRMDLIGPGSAVQAVERHFAESLAALPWLPAADAAAPARLLDLGSGAGFPGLVLAAARPDLEVVLVEPRERKRAFLAAAARRIETPVRILAARVDRHVRENLPPGARVVTVRALRLEPTAWSALASGLAPGASLIAWAGASGLELPAEFEPARELALPGLPGRRLLEFRIRPAAAPEGTAP